MGKITTTIKKPRAKSKDSISRVWQNESSRSSNSPGDLILYFQRTIGNQAVQKLIGTGTLQAKRRATAMQDMVRNGVEMLNGEMMKIEPEAFDQTPPLLNEWGLIDGEWISEVDAHAFINGGKTGVLR